MPSVPSDLDRIIDAVAWAETCFIIAASSRADPAKFKSELVKLEEASKAARKLVDAYEPIAKETLADKYSAKHFAIMKSLRTSELGLKELSKL
jgi:hypothetical protein